MLLKEGYLALCQGLHAILPSGYCIVSENTIERFDPTAQLFGLMEQTVNKTLAKKIMNIEAKNEMNNVEAEEIIEH